MPDIAWEDATPPRILVIDDNPSVHVAFDEILGREAADKKLEQAESFMFGSPNPPPVVQPIYQTDHALSGAEGVEKIRQALADAAPYQVAFVDIRMPGMDGVETIERMWKLDFQIQTVICTAYADYRWEDLAKRLGQTDRLLVLKKPFHNIEVMQLASTLTRKWILARQVAMQLEQAATLLARRTQRLLEIQHRENLAGNNPISTGVSVETIARTANEGELPVILLITENSAMRATIRQFLVGNYDVLEASSAINGVATAKENVPDLIIVDDAVATRDAMQLCADLKSDAMTSHTPVILLATDDSQTRHTRALDAGVSEFLVKPLQLPLLQTRVADWLENRRKWHEHFQQIQTVQPRELATNQMDAEFLRRVVEIVEKNLADYEFDVETLARLMAVSRRQLFRKFKAVAGGTPNGFIRDIRLKRAAQLLRDSRMTVSEIIYAVGFSDPKYFRTIFRERFGVLPGEYHKQTKPGA